MVKKTALLAIASLLFGSFASAHETHGHKCTHDDKDRPEPEIMSEMEELNLSAEGRTLQDYPNIRMKGYTGALADQSQEFQDYITNDILPPVLSYFSSALKIKSPFATNLKFSSSQKTLCSIPTPSEVHKGVPVDFYYMIDSFYDTSSTWVADTYACFLSGSIKRPYVAKTTINTDQFPLANNNVLLHEKNMVCIMHELTHALGFSKSLYKYFKDENYVTLTNHIQSGTVDGETGTILNLAPLTSRLRKFFGCPSMKGAYMEGSGGEGTASSHFERRHFGFEFMTSGLIYQMQVSEFSLAVLEGSGWYFPDYSYADEYHFGRGEGCYFLFTSCTPGAFDEWCTGSERGCTNVGRGGGVCAADTRSNGCRYIHPRVNYDCDNEGAVDYARLPQVETYGRGAGSKCFMGTLTTAKSASSTSFCFKSACSGSGTNTTVTLSIGGNQVVCTKEGPVTVAGYNGVINCPDPISHCATVGQKTCPRGCMGKGQCVDGACVCQDGFKGADCALRAGYGI